MTRLSDYYNRVLDTFKKLEDHLAMAAAQNQLGN